MICFVMVIISSTPQDTKHSSTMLLSVPTAEWYWAPRSTSLLDYGMDWQASWRDAQEDQDTINLLRNQFDF